MILAQPPPVAKARKPAARNGRAVGVYGHCILPRLIDFGMRRRPFAALREQLVAGADGMASALLINPNLGAGGCGIRLDYDRTALPCLIEWQCLQSGLYVLGIEPSTNHVLGRKFAEERGELIFLEHGETRHYRTRLSVLDGAEAVAAARRDIEALHPPPADFSAPTGDFPRLGGRR